MPSDASLESLRVEVSGTFQFGGEAMTARTHLDASGSWEAAARAGAVSDGDERDLESLVRIATLYPQLYFQKRLREWR